MPQSGYRGRFAPSPTGPLHFGSLVAAVASYADARHHSGTWLVRIEDVDETRCHAHHEVEILRALQSFGMHWDADPVRQSARTQRYDDVLDSLIDRQLVYRCTCSRKRIADAGVMGREGPIYPGTCRRDPPDENAVAAWRLIVRSDPIGFEDQVCGALEQDLARDVGDFVVKRLDGFIAYQLAVVVDDLDQGISDVVRGADLLWSTPRQLWLQQLIEAHRPRYLHVPLAVDEQGNKLSKRDGADPVNATNPVDALLAAWRHLGQQPPERSPADTDAFWQWATPRWHIERIPRDPEGSDDG